MLTLQVLHILLSSLPQQRWNLKVIPGSLVVSDHVIVVAEAVDPVAVAVQVVRLERV